MPHQPKPRPIKAVMAIVHIRDANRNCSVRMRYHAFDGVVDRLFQDAGLYTAQILSEYGVHAAVLRRRKKLVQRTCRVSSRTRARKTALPFRRSMKGKRANAMLKLVAYPLRLSGSKKSGIKPN